MPFGIMTLELETTKKVKEIEREERTAPSIAITRLVLTAARFPEVRHW